MTTELAAEQAGRGLADWYRALADSSRDAHAVAFPPDYRFEGANRAAVALYRVRDAAHLSAFSPNDLSARRQPNGELSSEAWPRILEQALAEGFWLGEWRARRPDGTEFLAEVQATRVSIGGRVGLQFAIRDISQRKLTELGMRAAKEQLQQEAHNKDFFLSMLSHELRSPLAAISNGIFVLSQGVDGEASGAMLGILDRQAKHLTRLVDDLLDLTRISSNKIALQMAPLDLSAVVRTAVEDQRILFDGAQIELELAIEPRELWMQGDVTRLSQVVENLLTNARKFTPAQGKVTVSLQGGAGRGEAVIRVVDTGRGLNPESVARIFDPFWQADETADRAAGGLGLGLWLVRSLVGLHRGSVTAASEGPGTGVVVTVTLPVQEAAPVARVSPPADQPRDRRLVLVIEDNAAIADTFCEVLRLLGHDVEWAPTGREGIERAGVVRPDIVFCDIGLPDMAGYDVARAIRAIPELATAQLFALTGYAAQRDVELAEQAGFDGHLAKPVSIDVLKQTLGRR